MNLSVAFRSLIVAGLVAALSAPVQAQLRGVPVEGLGPLGRVGGDVGRAVDGIAGAALDPLGRTAQDVRTLASARVVRLRRLVRANP